MYQILLFKILVCLVLLTNKLETFLRHRVVARDASSDKFNCELLAGLLLLLLSLWLYKNAKQRQIQCITSAVSTSADSTEIWLVSYNFLNCTHHKLPDIIFLLMKPSTCLCWVV